LKYKVEKWGVNEKAYTQCEQSPVYCTNLTAMYAKLEYAKLEFFTPKKIKIIILNNQILFDHF
jgi:hypothetical protein